MALNPPERSISRILFATLLQALLYTAVCVDAVTLATVEPSNTSVSGHKPGIQNEEQVWICPSDTNVVVAIHRDFRLGYRQLALARSANGGSSWVDDLIPRTLQKLTYQSDPAMTMTSSGHYVVAYLDFEEVNGSYDSSYITVLRSEDCGQSWEGPYTVIDTIGGFFEDKVFICSDRTGGQFDGSVYASWARHPNPSHIMFAASRDGGENWSDPIVVGAALYSGCETDTASAGIFSQPLVGEDGAVYVFWQGYWQAPPPDCQFYTVLRLNKSTDGGVSWNGERSIHVFKGAGIIEGGIDTYNQPVTDADLSNGPHKGNLYLQFTDNVASAPFHEDIWFRRSLDTGHTWSAPNRVNDDAPGQTVDQFHNWMVCNEEGILASIWYDQRTDPSHVKFDVFASYSYDGGATWTSNHRVSNVSIDPLLLGSAAMSRDSIEWNADRLSANASATMAGKIAEYIGLSCVHDKVVAVWTDTREGDQDVWSAQWQLPLTEPRLITETGVTLQCGDTLKWATAWKEREDRYYLQIAASSQFLPSEIVLNGLTDASCFELPPGLPDTSLFWRIKAYKTPYGLKLDSTNFSEVRSFSNIECPCSCDCHRDPMCDGSTDVIDVVSTVDVAFGGTSELNDPNDGCPYIRTDVNCDGITNVVDVVHMVNVVYRHTPIALGLCGLCN